MSEKTGNRKATKASAVKDEVSRKKGTLEVVEALEVEGETLAEVGDILEINDTDEAPIEETWGLRWAAFREELLGGADAPVAASIHTIGEAFAIAERHFPTGGILTFLGEQFDSPRRGGPISLSWVSFCNEVEADLTLESLEEDEEPASFPEFLEAVARQIDRFLLRNRAAYGIESPHEPDDMGVRNRCALPTVLGPATLFLFRVAQWFGEGVGRAGEQIPSPVHDPNWRPSGDQFPWSIAGAAKRRAGKGR